MKQSRFGLGLIIGSVIGGVTAFLLSPKTGKKNREVLNKKMADWKKMVDSGELEKKVNDIFGDISDESVRMYAMAREKVMKGLDELQNMDGDDYAKLVQKVIEEVKKQAKVSADKLKKLQESFIRDWPEMKEEVEQEGKKIAQKTKSNGQVNKASN